MAGFGPVGSTPVASIGGTATASINYTPGAGAIVYQGFAPSSAYSIPTIQTEWFGLEVLHTGGSSAQIDWTGIETLHTGRADIVIEWTGIETTHTGRAFIEVGYFGIEILMSIATKKTIYPRTTMII